MFFSVAAAWDIANEGFMSSLANLNQLKIKLSTGITGSRKFGYVIQATQSNLGLDYAFFEKRLSGNFNIYLQKAKDDYVISSEEDAYDQLVYVGDVINKGIEFSINVKVFDKKDFQWNSNFNIASNANNIGRFKDVTQSYFASVPNIGFINNFWYRTQINHPIGEFYGYQFERLYQLEDFDYRPELNASSPYVLKNGIPTSGVAGPGLPKFADQNGDGKIDEKDKVTLGNPHPKHFGGWNNTFRYKDFDLSVLFQWSYGFDIVNANRFFWEKPSGFSNSNKLVAVSDAWTPWNTDGNIAAHYSNGFDGGKGEDLDSRYVEDGSYLRLKTIVLGYNWMLKNNSFLNDLRIALSAQNLITWTNYSGLDPEASVSEDAFKPNLDYSLYPQSKTYGISLRATF